MLGTVAVLEAARAHGAQVVFSSTGGAIYGECETPATEEWERRPLSPYGASKLAGEEYLAAWNRLHGTRHVALRYGNVYGPRQDPHGEAGVVAIFLRAVSDGRRPTIFGDGSQERDYVYVGDVARATLAATGARRRCGERRDGSRDLGARARRRDAPGRPAATSTRNTGRSDSATCSARARRLARRARARLEAGDRAGGRFAPDLAVLHSFGLVLPSCSTEGHARPEAKAGSRWITTRRRTTSRTTGGRPDDRRVRDRRRGAGRAGRDRRSGAGQGLVHARRPVGQRRPRPRHATPRTPRARRSLPRRTRPGPQRRAKPMLARGQTAVLVLNGNGQDGAAGAEAARRPHPRLSRHGRRQREARRLRRQHRHVPPRLRPRGEARRAGARRSGRVRPRRAARRASSRARASSSSSAELARFSTYARARSSGPPGTACRPERVERVRVIECPVARGRRRTATARTRRAAPRCPGSPAGARVARSNWATRSRGSSPTSPYASASAQSGWTRAGSGRRASRAADAAARAAGSRPSAAVGVARPVATPATAQRASRRPRAVPQSRPTASNARPRTRRRAPPRRARGARRRRRRPAR